MGIDRPKLKRKGDEDTENKHPRKQPKLDNVNLSQWTSWQVHEWFLKKGFSNDICERFVGQSVDGVKLRSIDEESIHELELDITPKEKDRILEEIDVLKDNDKGSVQLKNVPGLYRTPTKYIPPGEETKVFNDPIHGHIEMHPLCVKIIDTRQFQRLRYLKQLGGCYLVYPGATHSRFEHSIGVSYLAGELTRMIQRRQPELMINDKDIICVEIAGLCHDLGHGPFSHMFDGRFIPSVKPGTNWKHEQASVQMFYHLVKKNNLEKEFRKFGLHDRDLKFIAEQIEGPRGKSVKEWPYEGRPESKSFLYEIVANKRNGIDVDKWDYFARDCHYLGIKNNFDHSRFTKFVRVIQVEDGQKQICSRDKEADNIYDMFATRTMLHKRAYQHKTNIIIERMICEAFTKANEYISFKGKDGKLLCLADTIEDMEAYSHVTDYVYHQILNSTSIELAPAREILERIECRELYKCVGQTKPKPNQKLNKSEEVKMREELVCSMTEKELGAQQLSKDDVVIMIVNVDYGMKDKNPLDNVRFYKKNSPDTAIKVRKDQVSEMLPERFSDQIIRVYSKNSDKKSCEVAEKCFNRWCAERDLTPPKGADMDLYMTPCKSSEASTSKDNDELNVAKTLDF